MKSEHHVTKTIRSRVRVCDPQPGLFTCRLVNSTIYSRFVAYSPLARYSVTIWLGDTFQSMGEGVASVKLRDPP